MPTCHKEAPPLLHVKRGVAIGRKGVVMGKGEWSERDHFCGPKGGVVMCRLGWSGGKAQFLSPVGAFPDWNLRHPSRVDGWARGSRSAWAVFVIDDTLQTKCGAALPLHSGARGCTLCFSGI